MARRVGLEQIGAEAVILGTPEFFRLAKQVEGHIDGINSKTKKLESDSAASWAGVAAAATTAAVAMTAAVVGATTALTALVGASINVAAEFEANLSVVRAITQGTAQQMESLVGVMNNIAQSTVIGLNSAAQAAGELARGGISIQAQLEGATKAVTDLTIASAGELEIGRSATLVAAALNAFSLEGKDATTVVNAITAAAQKSSVTFVDIQRSFQQAAAVAGAFGLTAQETAAAIGVLGVAGLRGSDAGTSLKQALIQLAKPTKQAREEMATYGINLFDAAGAARPFRDLIIDLQNKFGDLAVETGKITAAERNRALATIFGSDAIRAALVFAQQGVGVYDEMTRAQNDVAFSAENLAKIMQDNLNAQFIILQNNIGVAFNAIGTGFIPILRQATDAAIKFLQALNPQALALIGAAFSTIFTGAGLGEFVTKLSEVASAETAVKIQEIVAAFINLRLAITDQILPALGSLKDTIVSAFPTVTLTDFIVKAREISQAIRNIAEVGTGVIGVIEQIARGLIESGRAGDILKTALIGIVAVPLLSVAILFGPIIVAIASAVVQAALLVGVVGLLITNFDKLTGAGATLVATALGPIEDIISGRVTPATIALSAAMLLLAQIVIVRAATAFQIFAVSAAGALARVTAAVLAVNTATIVAFVTSIPRAVAASAVSFASLARIVVVASTAMVVSLVRVAIVGVAALVGSIVAAAVAIGPQAALIYFAVLGVIGIIGVLSQVWDGSWKSITHAVIVAANIILPTIFTIIRAVQSLISVMRSLPVLGGLVEGVGNFFDGLGTQVNQTVNGIGEGVGNAAAGIGDFAGGVVSAGQNVLGFSDELGALRSQFEGIAADAPSAVNFGDFNAQIAEAQARLTALANETPTVATNFRGLTDEANTLAGAIGGDDGGGKKGLKGAADKAGKALQDTIPAIEGFVDALTKAIRLQEFIDAFGDTGAKAIDALIEAVVSNIDKDGARAAEALHELVQEIRFANIPEWESLASELNHAFATALIERSDESIEAAKEVLARATDAMKAQGRLTQETFRSAFNLGAVADQLGSDGAKLIDNIKDALIKGGTDLVRAVGSTTHALITGFADKVPIETARDYGRQIVNAIDRVIRERTPDAVDALQDLIRSLNFQAEIKKITDARDKAIADSQRTLAGSLAESIKDTNDALRNLETERATKKAVDIQIDSLKELNDARIDALKAQQDWNRQVRQLLREERDIRQDRARDDVEAETNRLDAIAEARKKAAEKAREALKSTGTPVGGLTIQRVSGADDDLKKELANIEARFAKEKQKREEKRAAEDADRAQRLRDQAAESNQATVDAIAITNLRTRLGADVLALQNKEEERQHQIRIHEIVQRGHEQFLQANNAAVQAINNAQTVFEDQRTKLEFLTTLANDLFNEALREVRNINTELDTMFSRSRVLEIKITQGGGAEGEEESFARGGVVGGPIGRAKSIIAHGGELVLSLAQVKALETRPIYSNPTPVQQDNRVSYNVSANYEQPQDPGSILLDLQALAAMAAR